MDEVTEVTGVWEKKYIYEPSPGFMWPDYLVFALVLVVSAGIGVFYGCTGGKQKTTSEFLMANRQMTVLPTTLSLLASFMSAITLLGTPAEMYQYGTVYWWIWLGYGMMIPLAAHLFIPVFFRLKVTSVYEYLELRFRSKAVRQCGALTFMLQMVLYMAIVLYAPSLALEQVTGLNVWISVVSIGAVCTFYTAIGGMKAVMWTDSFQICMMFAGLIAVIVQGSIDKGGFDKVWQDNYDGGRIEFQDWRFNPLYRHTFWTCTFGGCFTWLAVYGVNQAQVQRALTVPKLKHAQIAMWLNFVLLTILLTICCLCGLVIFSRYKDCDPLTTGQVRASDQLLPFYVIENLNHVPGLPGLCVSCLFSAALSTISSGVNSLAAVTLQDLIMTSGRFKNMKDETAAKLSKIMALLYGLLCIALTFVASQLGNVLQAALGLFGMIGGPLLGLFFLGMCFPCANWIGALVGLFTGLLMTFWVGIGAQVYKHPSPLLNMSDAGCNVTYEFVNFTEPIVEAERDPADLEWYALSYLHYGTLAVIWVCFIGVTVSLATGSQEYDEVDPTYQNPISDIFCCCCPKLSLHWMRCLVPKYTEDEDEPESLDEKPIQNGNETANMNGIEPIAKDTESGLANEAYETDLSSKRDTTVL